MNHSRACLAKSAIAAIENFRDADWTDTEFIVAMERDVLLTAEGYLEESLVGCICKLYDRSGVVEIVNPYYKDRHTGEFAVVTENGVIYRDTPVEV